MTATRRGAHSDPVDRVESYAYVLSPNTAAERDRARDAIAARATSIHDLYALLGALGLDQADEITAQAARCQQGDQT